MNYVAFDLGGSGGKILLAKYFGDKLYFKEIHRFENHPTRIANSLYWNIISIYENLIYGLKKVKIESGINSLGIDTFSNDFAFINKSKDLISQVHCYRDERSIRCIDKINNIMPPKERYYSSGNQIAPSNTLMHLSSMIEEDMGYMLENSYKMLFIPDLLISFLTGEIVSEYTISSVSEMYDFVLDNWNEKIITNYKVPKHILPEIVKPGTIIGNILKDKAQSINSKPFNVVAVCEHDTASAFASTPCDNNSIIISSGTWSLVGTETDKPILSDFAYKNNVVNEGGLYLHHRIMKNVMGLWLIQESKRCLSLQGEDYSYDELNSLALSAKPFQYLIDPDDIDFFTQGDMIEKIKQKCMKVFNKKPEETGEIIRCILESLSFKYRYAIEIIEKVVEKKLSTIHIVGGGCKDELLCQFTANACQKEVIAGPSDATAIGNILVQMLAFKEISNIEEGRDIVRKSCDIKKYKPANNQKIWDEVYIHYKYIYKLDN